MILNGWNVIYRVSFDSDNPLAHDDFNTKEEAIAWAEEHLTEKPIVKAIELFTDDDGNIDPEEGESEIIFSYKDGEETEENEEPSLEDRLSDLETRLNSIEQFLEEPKSEEELAGLGSEEKLSSEEVVPNKDDSDGGIPEESKEVSVEVDEPVEDVEEDPVEEISDKELEVEETAEEDIPEESIVKKDEEDDFEPYAFMGEKPAPEDVYVDPFNVDFDDVINESLIIKTYIDEYRPWSGAVDTYNKIIDADKLDELESLLEASYPNGLTMTELNDILWLEGEQILSDLGISEEEVEDSEEDEELEESAKPGLDNVSAFNSALEIAKKENKPVIYGYMGSNHHGERRYFPLDYVVCDDLLSCTKKVRDQYHPTGSVLVAYPDKEPVEECLIEAIESDYPVQGISEQELVDLIKKIPVSGANVPTVFFQIGVASRIPVASAFNGKKSGSELVKLLKLTEFTAFTGTPYGNLSDTKERQAARDRLGLVTGKHTNTSSKLSDEDLEYKLVRSARGELQLLCAAANKANSANGRAFFKSVNGGPYEQVSLQDILQYLTPGEAGKYNQKVSSGNADLDRATQGAMFRTINLSNIYYFSVKDKRVNETLGVSVSHLFHESLEEEADMSDQEFAEAFYKGLEEKRCKK